MQTQSNYLAILVSTILYMVVGFVWYSPALFAKPWMKLINKTKKDITEGMKPYLYPVTIILTLLTVYILSFVIRYTNATTVFQGAWTGLLLWLGFSATASGIAYLFEGRSWKLFAINYGYHLVGLIIAGAVLAVWR